jgi:hypothetical protein
VELVWEPYREQAQRWPECGKVILAQYDAESVIVYQAYRPSIGSFAVEHGYFGGDFSLARMSWIKPNFLWMMYRSGWGTKEGQEVTLAVRLQRSFFDSLLRESVASSFGASGYADSEHWQAALKRSSVRLQWDPDHDPRGNTLERRALQLGLRGAVLEAYARDAIIDIDDISELVERQRAHALSSGHAELRTPREDVYPVADPEARRRLGL